MSDLADNLSKAIFKKENDINCWTWKNSKGVETRMMDLTPEQLKHAYTHVTEMLYNKDPYKLGVVCKRDQVHKMWDHINSELLLRYILYTCKIDGLSTNKDLLDVINDHKAKNDIKNSDLVTSIFEGLPDVFKKINIDSLLSACLGTLPAFNKKLITDKFILSIGIWLTEQEKKDLTEYDSNGNFRDRKSVIKERLFLNNNAAIRFDSKGLSYAEFRALVRIEGYPKLTSIPTDTLILLRDKVLLLLDQDLEYHINKWTTIKERLETVAKTKNLNLI